MGVQGLSCTLLFITRYDMFNIHKQAIQILYVFIKFVGICQDKQFCSFVGLSND